MNNESHLDPPAEGSSRCDCGHWHDDHYGYREWCSQCTECKGFIEYKNDSFLPKRGRGKETETE